MTHRETLGKKSKQHKAHAQIHTLKSRGQKEYMDRRRTSAKKSEAPKARYAKANRKVKRSIKRDQQNFEEDFARPAEDAAGK